MNEYFPTVDTVIMNITRDLEKYNQSNIAPYELPTSNAYLVTGWNEQPGVDNMDSP